MGCVLFSDLDASVPPASRSPSPSSAKQEGDSRGSVEKVLTIKAFNHEIF
jgi:hypothetical protein